jgi:hypothetical protein
MGFDSSLYDTVPQTSAAGIVALVRATLVAGKGLTYATRRRSRPGDAAKTGP